MRLTVAAIGRLRGGPELDLVTDYAARIRAIGRSQGVTTFDIKEIDPPTGPAGEARRQRESARLLKAVAGSAKRIALDERGEALASETFARRIADWRDGGAGEIAFLVGGADGHHPSLIAAADFVVAFGRATFPHMLVRAMLVEQIYRAMTILSGHPYHRA